MLIEMLDDEIKEALADRLESWELVEFLNIDVHDIIELLEDDILNKLPDVLEFARIEGVSYDEDNPDPRHQ